MLLCTWLVTVMFWSRSHCDPSNVSIRPRPVVIAAVTIWSCAHVGSIIPSPTRPNPRSDTRCTFETIGFPDASWVAAGTLSRFGATTSDCTMFVAVRTAGMARR